ncbi:hypothetical protein L204_101701 [Cryptococcus depauperatus]
MKRLETNKDGDRQHPSSHRPHHAFQLRRKDTRDEDEDLQNVSTWPRYIMRMRHWRSFAKYCPLISATLAPLSTLMDIPALTYKDYMAQIDAYSVVCTSNVFSSFRNN